MAAPAPSRFVVDVGDADFAAEVLERSHRVPVVVDFWAPWCGPCRTLGPILERLAEEHAGAFVLAKVDVDASPVVAGQLQIRSIPLVIGFRDGRPVSEFTGAQPEAAVRRFLAALLPSEADALAAEGEARLAAGEAAAAQERFDAALARDPRHAAALLGLARVHAERGDAEAAQQALGRIVAAPPELAQAAEHLAAELRTGEARASGAELETLRARAAERPDDLAARLALGRALAAAGRFEEALPEMLAVVERDKAFEDEAARKAMLDAFEVLGGDHPLTQQYRRALARALFR